MSPLILLVDRDYDTRQILRTYLEHHGHRVLETPDGEEALDLAREHDPAVIIGDFPLDVPGHSPFVEALRNEAGSRAPVLSFSARVSPDDLSAAWAVSTQVLTKPASPIEVLREVDRLLAGVEHE
jgi:DNA-binding response OmpR family regulator